ncbi:alpha-amylase-like protein [Lasiosphaeris hirsuta]|uniref:Alpha-amylase-like protein n=1 Tax=Lasiosphaeris hirsuta TaxID=260670 RepID=A0AA40AYT9_9PEZI|nr:alpha-amylase-like protein [Lasiosphaeris hirsuta]
MSAFLGLPPPAGPSPPPSPTEAPSSALRPWRARRPAAQWLPNPVLIPAHAPCPANPTMLQGFEWYMPADGAHWGRLAGALPALAALGVSSVWIPPACKAARPEGNGYDIYDLYDLGEFEQKGTTRTKWGGKKELVALVKEAEGFGIGVIFDAVLNHKAAADYSEEVIAERINPKDRRKVVGEEGVIQAWTGYEFPGRRGAYSPLKWNKEHFTGIDYDDRIRENGVWKFRGKEWAEDVDEELGNYDYLLVHSSLGGESWVETDKRALHSMFADVDHRHPDVRRDLFYWAGWLRSQMKLGGLRLDAIKHYSFEFLRDFITHIQQHVDPNWFLVGEYWREDSEFLARYIEYMGHRISLFDVQLVTNLSKVSLLGEKGDLRQVFDDALVVWKPNNTVTFVVNHDTQDGQSLETPVAPSFIPLAYSLILLRANAGIPCVFWSDLYGSFGQHPRPDRGNFIPPNSGGAVLPKMMLARQLWAYGSQFDYLDQPHCIGFTRHGHPARSGGDGLAVVMTNGWAFASKKMFVGEAHAREVWTDVLRWCPGKVVIDSAGWGEFPVACRSVSVWVNRAAQGREFVDSFVFNHDIYGFEKEAEEAARRGAEIAAQRALERLDIAERGGRHDRQ